MTLDVTNWHILHTDGLYKEPGQTLMYYKISIFRLVVYGGPVVVLAPGSTTFNIPHFNKMF